MAKIHYYIISYNTARNEWELDAEAEETHFPDGTILDLDEANWFRDYSGDGDYYPEAEKLTEQIAEAINQLNKGLKS